MSRNFNSNAITISVSMGTILRGNSGMEVALAMSLFGCLSTPEEAYREQLSLSSLSLSSQVNRLQKHLIKLKLLLELLILMTPTVRCSRSLIRCFCCPLTAVDFADAQ